MDTTTPLQYPEAAAFLVKMSQNPVEVRLEKDGSVEYLQQGGPSGVFYYPDDIPAWLRSWLRVEVAVWRHLLREQQPHLSLSGQASFLVCGKDEKEEDEDDGILCVMVFYAHHPVIRDVAGDAQRWGSSGTVQIKFYYRFYAAECKFCKHE